MAKRGEDVGAWAGQSLNPPIRRRRLQPSVTVRAARTTSCPA